MAAMRHTHTSYPPSKSNKFSASSATDTFDCEYLRSEIYVLCSEVKSLTEIINILNSELKNDRPKNDVIMSTPCDSCAQMDNKLRKFEEEISSLKLIIIYSEQSVKLQNKCSKTI